MTDMIKINVRKKYFEVTSKIFQVLKKKNKKN